MLFGSYVFVFGFLPLTLLGFFLFSRIAPRAGAAFLVLASLVFYGWWRPEYVLLLVGSIGFNFLIGEAMVRLEVRERLQSALLVIGIFTNLLVLFYFKYFVASLLLWQDATHSSFAIEPILLPIGISFFTFTQIAYLLDAKDGLTKGRGLLNYLLFVTFFPHLLAGPILHHREVMPQFADAKSYRFSSENLAVGLAIFAIGLVKKCVVADTFSYGVGVGFGQAHTIGTLGAWDTTLSYQLQIYFDFSGYSDMAIGLARMFNITFPANFNSPYKARSIIDFWARWHMTLTRYLTLLLYNPMALAVARWRAARGHDISIKSNKTVSGFSMQVAMPTLVTMGLAGIWHGAGWQFFVFGLLHSLYLTVNHAWRQMGPRNAADPQSPIARTALVMLQVGFTFLCVLVAEVFFRAPSVGVATDMLGGMAGLHGFGEPLVVPDELIRLFGPVGHAMRDSGVLAPGNGDGIRHLGWLLAVFAVAFFAPNTQEILADWKPVLGKVKTAETWLRWKPSMAYAFGIGTLLAMGIMAISGTHEFLYFQF